MAAAMSPPLPPGFTHSLYQIVEAMAQYGGSFARTLAQLFRVADDANTAKLIEAFHDQLVEYDAMLTLRDESTN